MNVTVVPEIVPVAGVPGHVTIRLSVEEAQKLRRVCYYNRTVGQRYEDNPVGGTEKGNAITAFLGSLGNALKVNGISRF